MLYTFPKIMNDHHSSLMHNSIRSTFIVGVKLLILLIVFFGIHQQSTANVHIGSGQQFTTLQEAVNAIRPGDTVLFHEGKYAGYQGISNLKGSAQQWIVFAPFENDVVEIAGAWQFMSCEYLKFLHLTFRGTPEYPGRLFSVDNSGSCQTPSKFIIVENCSFSNTTDPTAITAFKMSGVDSFAVTNCTFSDIPACEAMDYNVCSNGIVKGNRFENCLSGGHIKGGASNITMEANIFINASQAPWVAYELGGDTGAEFYCPEDSFEVSNLNFYSNIVIGGYRGIALSSARKCKIINNTFYNCGQATWRFLTTSTLYPELSGNIIENNLLAFGLSAYINGGKQPPDAAVFSNNIYYSITAPTFTGPYWDTPDLDAIKDKNPLLYGSTVPMFVAAQNQDFRLVASSPAIGTGKPETEPTTDYYGKPFSQTRRSIGAVEVESTSAIETVDKTVNANITIYPNPTSNYIEIRGVTREEQVSIITPIGTTALTASTKYPIDLSKLPSGVYLVIIGKSTKIIIKQ